MNTQPRPVAHPSGKARRAGSRRNELLSKWEARMQLLRSALSSNSADSYIMKQITECIDLYKVSLSSSRSTENLLAALAGRNMSFLEASFLWLGGWRPTSAITLVLSKMGMEVQSVDEQIDPGTSSCCLSKAQLASVEVLLKQTRHAEGELSTELATLQMLLPDQNMAEAVSVGNVSVNSVADKQYLMEKKIGTLRNLFAKSNRLRMQTLQKLLNLLTPVQAAQCTIAAYDLVFAMRTLGNVPLKSNGNSSTSQTGKTLNHEADERKNDVGSLQPEADICNSSIEVT